MSDVFKMLSNNLIHRLYLHGLTKNYFCLKLNQHKKCFQRFKTNVVERKRFGEWESVVGLEIHAQILSNSKLFSGSGTDYYLPTNCAVSFFDAALPGTLPVINKRCVEAAVLTALALNCQLNKTSIFDRKHYFYADMPAGYQITQQRLPLAKQGKLPFVVLNVQEPYCHESRIIQLQLEQDSGKSYHNVDDTYSHIDLNRAGLALMEIVFDADLSSGEEAASLVEELQYLLQRLGTCDGKMEEGSLRVDANVSVNRPGEPWGTRTEVKNLGSIKSVAKAVDYEIKRQIQIIENGGKIHNETRMFDSKLKATVPMRDKETQQDYRFMPEPNLPPLRLCQDVEENIPGAVSIAEIAKLLPVRLPFELRQDLLEKYNLPLKMIDSLVKHDGLLQIFMEIMKEGKRDSKSVMHFLTSDLYSVLNKRKKSLMQCSVSSSKLGEVLDFYQKKQISQSNKIELLNMLFDGDHRNISEIIAEKNWKVITDKDTIEKLVTQAIEQNPKLVKLYKKKKATGIDGLIRRTQRLTNDQLDMGLVISTLENLLEK